MLGWTVAKSINAIAIIYFDNYDGPSGLYFFKFTNCSLCSLTTLTAEYLFVIWIITMVYGAVFYNCSKSFWYSISFLSLDNKANSTAF